MGHTLVSNVYTVDTGEYTMRTGYGRSEYEDRFQGAIDIMKNLKDEDVLYFLARARARDQRRSDRLCADMSARECPLRGDRNKVSEASKVTSSPYYGEKVKEVTKSMLRINMRRNWSRV